MAGENKYRGYYCAKCHNYSRIYLNPASGYYEGSCNKCGAEISLPQFTGDESLFRTAPRKEKKKKSINIWDSYLGGKIIASIEAGTPAKVLRTTKYNGVTWYQIKYGKFQGWVSGSFIRKLKD